MTKEELDKIAENMESKLATEKDILKAEWENMGQKLIHLTRAESLQKIGEKYLNAVDKLLDNYKKDMRASDRMPEKSKSMANQYHKNHENLRMQFAKDKDKLEEIEAKKNQELLMICNNESSIYESGEMLPPYSSVLKQYTLGNSDNKRAICHALKLQNTTPITPSYHMRIGTGIALMYIAKKVYDRCKKIRGN